jgi:hypothetical protein
VTGETLATALSYDGAGDDGASTLIDGRKLRISVQRV